MNSFWKALIVCILVLCLLLVSCAGDTTITKNTKDTPLNPATTRTSTSSPPGSSTANFNTAFGQGGPGGQSIGVDISTIQQKSLDVAYAGISNSQKLDIYLPNSGNGPFPAIFQIHGGAFRSGDKNSGELMSVLSGLNRGYAVVAVNYRLSGEAQFPAQINDVKAAIRFIRASAGQFNINPDKLAVWGDSAGASLAALAGTSVNVKELQDDTLGNAGQSDRVLAIVDWYGPIYFSTMDAEFAALGITPAFGATSSPNSPESGYLGKTIGSSEAEPLVKQASAETYISIDDPPFFIQHGSADRNVPITQSRNFSNVLKAVLGDSKVTFEAIEGAVHLDPKFETSDNLNKTLDFLDKYLK
jgi:acetyl esterase/lipase